MNFLQDNGVISDNCVTAADVPDAYFDLCQAYLDHLAGNFPENKKIDAFGVR